jgi:hypothetical protein
MRRELHNFYCHAATWEAMKVLSVKSNLSMSKLVELAVLEALKKAEAEVDTQ